MSDRPLPVLLRRIHHAAAYLPTWIRAIKLFVSATNPYTSRLGGWLGSRVVSVLDSGAERRRRARVQIADATLSGNSLRQTVHTHCASVHQAAKLVAVLLRVAGVTAGLVESNGSLPPELIPVLGSQPAGDVSHKPGGRLPLLSARPAVTRPTLKKAAPSFAAW